MIIGISGVDGSGKTTLAKTLSRDLTRELSRTEYVFLGDYFLLDPLVKFIRMSRPNTDGKKNPLLNTSPKRLWQKLWIILVIFDNYARFLQLKITSLFLKRNFVCDRYFYDRLAGLEFYRYTNSMLSQVYLLLTPRPDLAIILNVSEKVAQMRERKETHSLAFYRRLSRIYKRLAKRLNIKVTDCERYTSSSIAKTVIMTCIEKAG